MQLQWGFMLETGRFYTEGFLWSGQQKGDCMHGRMIPEVGKKTFLHNSEKGTRTS